MKHFATRVLIALSIFASAVAIFGGYYYVRNIQPTLTQAHDVLAQLTPADRALPKELFPLVNLADGRALSFVVARSLVFQGIQKPACPNSLGWHGCMFLLSTAMDASLSREELTLLWSKSVYLGYRELGFSAAARERFSKQANALSLEEVAELVAIEKSPSAYKDNPERLSKRKRWLLENFATRG